MPHRTEHRIMIVGWLLALSGCANMDWAPAAKAGWDVIRPEYEQYVVNDPRLSEESKSIRGNTSLELTNTLDAAAGVK